MASLRLGSADSHTRVAWSSTRVVPHGGHSMPLYQPLAFEYWSKPDQIGDPQR
jgi:hypothetical protein